MNQDLPGFRKYKEQLMPGFDPVVTDEFNLDDLYDNFYYSDDNNSIVGVKKGYDKFMQTSVESTGMRNESLYMPGFQHLGKQATKGTDLNSQELNSMWRSAVNKYPELGIKYGQLLPEDINKRLEALNKLASYKDPNALRTIRQKRFAPDEQIPVHPKQNVSDPNYFSSEGILNALKTGAVHGGNVAALLANPVDESIRRLRQDKPKGISDLFSSELGFFEAYDYIASPMYGYLGTQTGILGDPNVQARKKILDEKGGKWWILGEIERNAAAWNQASQAGEISAWRQFAVEVVGSPEELLPGIGMYAGLFKASATGSKLNKQLLKHGLYSLEDLTQPSLTAAIRDGASIDAEDIKEIWKEVPDYADMDTNSLIKLLDSTIALKNRTYKEIQAFGGTTPDEFIDDIDVQATIGANVPAGGSRNINDLSDLEKKDLLEMSYCLDAELEKNIREIKNNLLQRDFVGGVFILEAQTGTIFNSYLLTSPSMNKSIFGQGVYASDSRWRHAPGIGFVDEGRKFEDAQIVPVGITNPLVIDTDSAWKTLLTEAGIYKNENDSLILEYVNTPTHISEALQKTITNAGYDGVIVRVSGTAKRNLPEGGFDDPLKNDSQQYLRQMFGWDTVVKFDTGQGINPDDIDRVFSQIVALADKRFRPPVKPTDITYLVEQADTSFLTSFLGLTDQNFEEIIDILKKRGVVEEVTVNTSTSNPSGRIFKPTESAITLKLAREISLTEGATEVDKLRAAGMEDIITKGETVPEEAIIREVGSSKTKTLQQAIDDATSTIINQASTAQEEADQFNKLYSDLQSGSEDLAESTREWVIDHQDELVDNFGMDPKVFSITDEGFMGGIADESLLSQELNRLSQDFLTEAKNYTKSAKDIENRILDAEQEIVERGARALDEPSITRSVVIKQIEDIKSVFNTKKPTGGWLRVLNKALKGIEDNSRILNESNFPVITDVKDLIQEFKNISRSGLTTKQYSEAKDKAYADIKKIINEELTPDEFISTLPDETLAVRETRLPDINMQKDAEMAYVNNVEPTPPKRTSRIESFEFNHQTQIAPPVTRTTPELEIGAIEGVGGVVPPGRGNVSNNLQLMFAPDPKRPFLQRMRSWWDTQFLNMQERFNDQFYGLRKMQGVFEKSLKKIDAQLAKGSWADLITILTRVPGASNAAMVRFQTFGNKLKITAPNTLPEHIDAYLSVMRQLEILSDPKLKGRVIPGVAPDAPKWERDQFENLYKNFPGFAEQVKRMNWNSVTGEWEYDEPIRASARGALPGPEGTRKVPPESIPRWTKEMLEKELRDMEHALGPELWDELEAAGKVILDEYDNIRERLLQSGVIGPQLAEIFRTKHKYYNPISYENTRRTILEDTDAYDDIIVGSAKSFNVYENGIRALSEEGSVAYLKRPLDLVGDSLLRAEVLVLENDAAKAMIGLAKAVGVKDLKRIPDFEKADPKTAISYFENGKQITYNVPVWMKREAEYIRTTGIDDVGKFIGAINGISRAAFTTVSPIFIPVNILNDMITAFLTRGILPHQTGARLITSFTESHKLVEEAHRVAGGYQARFYGEHQAKLPGSIGVYNGEVLGKQNYQRIVKNAFADTFKTGFGITKFGEAAEQAPRQAFFKREMDKAFPKKTVVEGVARNSSEISVDELRQIHGIGKPTVTPIEGVALGKIEPDKFQKMIGKEVGFEYQYTAEQISQMPIARKAAADSVELTLNFARGGKFIKNANQYVIFLNAAMEGLKLPFRSIRENPNSRIRIGLVAMGQANLTIYNLGYPEYQDIPSEERWGSVIVMLPSFKKDKATGRPLPNYISIVPRTREWALFLSPITWMLERGAIEHPADFADFAQQIGGASMPLNEIPTPVILKEAIQQLANYDMFRGRDIVPTEVKSKKASDEVMPWTSPTFRKLGEKIDFRFLGQDIGVSPIRAEHAFYSTFGGTGRAITSGLTDKIIEWMDPSLISPEMVDLKLKFEDLSLPVERREFLNNLSPESREEFLYELNKPDVKTGLMDVPVIGGVLSGVAGRVAPGHYGDLRARIEKSVGEETGIDPEQTREVHAELRTTGERNRTAQYNFDKELLSGNITPQEWIENRKILGQGYREAFKGAEVEFSNSAHFADSEKRERFYGEVAKLGGLTNPDILKGKVLLAGYYAIDIESVSSEETDFNDPDSSTSIPDALAWDRFWTARTEYLNSLTEEEAGILDSELKASMTPLEREYFEDNKLIQPFMGLTTNVIKYINGDMELDDIELSEYGIELVQEMKNTFSEFDISLENYSDYRKKQQTDVFGGRLQDTKEGETNNVFHEIEMLMNRLRKWERFENYELEKALYKWGKIKKPANEQLSGEVISYGGYDRPEGGVIDSPLGIDTDLIKQLQGQYELEPEPVGVR